MKYSGLFTDLYELTMMQGYMLQNTNEEVVFDMFYRKQPFSGGYSIFTGLGDLLDRIEKMFFSDDDIAYLRSIKIFKEDFLNYLKDFHFSGSVYAMDEGSVIFPGEPILRIHSTLMEAQLIESLILNTLNFQTLIATKAARVSYATGEGTLLEFGLRRAQGFDGAISASKAAFIGGADATSNTIAGNACIGSGFGPSHIDTVIGILKAYTTRVGEGPFPTELFDKTGETIQKQGGEFGATTGRKRRCGWLDAVIANEAVRLNGINGFAITKLDVLSGHKTLKIANPQTIVWAGNQPI